MVKLVKEQFPKVEKMYEAHCQTDLSLTLMKIEHDKNMKSIMPTCKMEEINGYALVRSLRNYLLVYLAIQIFSS